MSSETNPPPARSPQRVRAWLADHLIIDYVADDDSAVHGYISTLRRSIGNLRVTVEPLATRHALTNGWHARRQRREGGGFLPSVPR